MAYNPEPRELVSIEDVYLADLMRKERKVTLITMNGYQIRGIIQDFDEGVIIVKTEKQELMVYRHGLSTIVLSESKKAGDQ